MGNGKESPENKTDDWRWPWRRNPVNEATPSWMKKIEKANAFLSKAGSGYVIDEIALMFANRHLHNVWLNEAVKGSDVEIFNAADDHVRVEPFGSEYDVQYTFLRTPMPDVRVEAMFIKSGVSPLHVAHGSMSHAFTSGDQPLVVHFSFKVESPGAYGLACAEMEALGGVLGQACFSDYGKFSYWKFAHAMNEEFSGIWIKPRVNMRAWAESEKERERASGPIKPGETAQAMRRSHLRALDDEVTGQ